MYAMRPGSAAPVVGGRIGGGGRCRPTRDRQRRDRVPAGTRASTRRDPRAASPARPPPPAPRAAEARATMPARLAHLVAPRHPDGAPCAPAAVPTASGQPSSEHPVPGAPPAPRDGHRFGEPVLPQEASVWAQRERARVRRRGATAAGTRAPDPSEAPPGSPRTDHRTRREEASGARRPAQARLRLAAVAPGPSAPVRSRRPEPPSGRGPPRAGSDEPLRIAYATACDRLRSCSRVVTSCRMFFTVRSRTPASGRSPPCPCPRRPAAARRSPAVARPGEGQAARVEHLPLQAADLVQQAPEQVRGHAALAARRRGDRVGQPLRRRLRAPDHAQHAAFDRRDQPACRPARWRPAPYGPRRRAGDAAAPGAPAPRPGPRRTPRRPARPSPSSPSSAAAVRGGYAAARPAPPG